MPLIRISALSSLSLPTLPALGSEPIQVTQGVPFVIRTVRQQDLSGLAEILASSFHDREGILRWLYPLLRAGIYEDLRTRLFAPVPYHACLVAARRLPLPPGTIGQTKSGEYPIGTVELSLKSHYPWSFASSRYLYLSNLAVRADCRRQGVARQLLRTCERVALDWGFRDLYLHVLENNHQARRLYIQEGYQVQQIEMNLGCLLFGRPRQVLLRKRLNKQQGKGV